MATIKRYAEKYNAKVKEWQKRQRDLMRGNDFLTKDYQRENAQKLAYDLGFRLENKDLIVDKVENAKYNEVDEIVDEHTPCLVRNEDGAIVNTTMVKASKSDIDQVMSWKNRKRIQLVKLLIGQNNNGLAIV